MYTFLLKTFLRLHQWTFDQVMYRLAPHCFGGSHPKNIFHYRSEFFLENLSQEDVVLDLACGQGTMLKRLAKGIKLGIGIDQNSKMLALARKECPPNLDFREGNIYGEEVRRIIGEKSVTKITLSHILEHLEDPVTFLLGLGGKDLLICVPSEENWYRQLLKHLGIFHLSDPTHFREYTRALLVEHLSAAGYQAGSLGFNSEGEIICRASR
jgi:SAM-dependent methyltransferase